MRWQFVLLALVFLGIGLLYSRVSTAYFCSHDDFDAVHRAAFQDQSISMRSHDISLANLYVLSLEQDRNLPDAYSRLGSPSVFRVRNLLLHLVDLRSDTHHCVNVMTHTIQPVTGDTKMQGRVDWSTLKRECPDDPGTACLMDYSDGHVDRYSNSAGK